MTIILTTCAPVGSGLRCGHIYLPIQQADEDKKRNVMYSTGGWTGVTCLHLACRFVAPDDIVKALLDIRGKQLVMMTTISGNTALHYACWNTGGSYNVTKMLLLTSTGKMSSWQRIAKAKLHCISYGIISTSTSRSLMKSNSFLKWVII